MATYKGIYPIKNRHKYRGDANNIVYRSSWEFRIMLWCDESPEVKNFSSEEIVIPYRSVIDGKLHRYFVDFLIEFANGKKLLVEVKPEKETRPPKPPKKKTPKSESKYLLEAETWAKNHSKWLAAIEYANKNDMQFCVWTETTLRDRLGFVI